jgi:hypothetical protein
MGTAELKARRAFPLAICCALSSACASTVPKNTHGVLITENPQQTAGCTYVATLDETNWWGLGDTEEKMAEKAKKLGGDTLFVVLRGAGQRLHGEIYRCQKQPGGTEPAKEKGAAR